MSLEAAVKNLVVFFEAAAQNFRRASRVSLDAVVKNVVVFSKAASHVAECTLHSSPLVGVEWALCGR